MPDRFDRPELARLWAAVRGRLEASAGATVQRVTVDGLAPDERAAIAELLGLDRLPGERTAVPMARLEAVLADRGTCARQVVEAVGGPLRDRAAERAAAQADREALWAWLASHPTVRAEPGLQTWVAGVRAAGIMDGSVAATRVLLASALRVLAALPADGRPLASFADDVCGDPHALDDGRRLASLVLRGVAAWRDVPFPDDAEARRALWAEVGVARDALSAAVLVAGLRPEGPSPLAASLRTWADEGQATWVTLAQLEHDAPLRLAVPIVWAVENPSVISEALARFGPACPPVVCTSGWPSSAALRLLRDLGQEGAALRYAGDLDGDGVRIAAHLAERVGAQPWGMGVEDYRRWASDVPNGPPVGRVSDAPWDPHLASVMRELGVAVFQERRCAELLDAMAGR